MKAKRKSAESIQYSFVPNRRAIMEALCRTRLSGAEFRAIILIMNQTDGYLREEDIIKPQFFEERAGLVGGNRRRTLGRLRRWRIIAKNKHVYKVLTPDQWAEEVFLQKRVKNDTVIEPKRSKKRVKNDTPTVSNLTRSAHENDTLLACSKENILKKTILKKTPAKKARGDPRVKKVLDTISEELGSQVPFYAKEGAAVKRALEMGHTVEQIIGCWRKMKSFTFWQGKWLPLAKVTENIGEFVAGRLTDGKPEDNSRKAAQRRAKVHGADEFQSRQW